MGIKVLVGKDSQPFQVLQAQKRSLKTAVQGMKGFISAQLDRAELPIAKG
jgi:hypothetical protein